MQRIEEIVKPSGQQQSALEKLKQTSENAADELRASCPTRTAEAPVARLDEMYNRLGAMVQAVKNLRPTLATFYASLSDEQKAQLNIWGSRTRGTQMAAGRNDPTASTTPRHQSRCASDRTSHAHYLWLALA